MRYAVGMSGGVDSSVAAMLLKEQGHEVVGITMRLWREGFYKGGARAACFGAHEVEDNEKTRALCESIGIEHRVFDCFDSYNREVLAYFRETYLSGKTPNPCVRCNELVKFAVLPRLAREAGLKFDKFATGHYARIVRRGNRFAVARAVDESKDQSYFLYRLSQEQLSGAEFPLGGYTKREIRELAKARGLVVAERPDSQDFYSGEQSELIGEPDRPGNIVDLSGKVLGKHNGFWHYTVGQRKGLGIGGGIPFYVVDLNACRNEVIVGRADDAVKTSLEVTDMVYGALEPPPAARGDGSNALGDGSNVRGDGSNARGDGSNARGEVSDARVECLVKVRSAGAPKGPAFLIGNRCEFPAGIAGIAPGQSAVFYSPASGEILAGGIIA